LEGTARITEGGSAEVLITLAQRYVRPDTKYPPMDNPPAEFVTRVTVTKVGGVGRGPDEVRPLREHRDG
jgi:hypothetical protein